LYKKDFDKAGELFDNVKSVQGVYYYPANYYSGYIAYKQERYPEALGSFREAEKSELYKPVVPYYIANIYLQQKKYDDVISFATAYTKVEKTQNTLEMQQLVGKAYFEKGQYEKAMPYFTAYMSGASKLNKADIYQVGYCQYQVKDYSAAINSFRELNVLKDSLGQNALYLLADCYLKTNQKITARLAFEEAARMNFDPFVREHASFQFAKLSYELNYHDVSVTALQDFIAAYPKSAYAEEAKEYLTLEFLTTQNYADALEILRTMPLKNQQTALLIKK
jgi:predicted negative regulator of RcsB-dependent stress response